MDDMFVGWECEDCGGACEEGLIYCDDCAWVAEMEDDDDRQPDEAQEWYDLDPSGGRKPLPCNDLGSAGLPRPT